MKLSSCYLCSFDLIMSAVLYIIIFLLNRTHLFMLGRSFHQDLALSVLSRTWKMSVLLKSGTLLNVTALNTLILFRFCIKMFCMFPSKLSVIPTVSKCALLFFFSFSSRVVFLYLHVTFPCSGLSIYVSYFFLLLPPSKLLNY